MKSYFDIRLLITIGVGLICRLSHGSVESSGKVEPIFDDVIIQIAGLSYGLFEIEDDEFKSEERHIEIDPAVSMTTPELIQKDGYIAETHMVRTEDGYELTLHRIPATENPTGRTVFLQHGILGSSADWVITGKGKGLAFLLADKGYDVWLGNARGNTYSKNHIRYPSTDVRFWNFSWHEMGVYDLPAALTYVSGIKNNSKIFYIGHSMGTTMSYVFASERPEIADKTVLAMFSLAPVAFVNHMKSPLRLLTPFINRLEEIARFLGKGEFLPQNEIVKLLSRYGCDIVIQIEEICSNIVFVIVGFDNSQFNNTIIPVLLGHTPAGTSTNAVVHYAQEVVSGKFRRFDYGTKINLQIYNNTEPPDYDLSKIRIPVGLFWSDNDWLASKVDVKRLAESLSNPIVVYEVNYPKFNHIDFLWAIDVYDLVYKKLFSVLDHWDQHYHHTSKSSKGKPAKKLH